MGKVPQVMPRNSLWNGKIFIAAFAIGISVAIGGGLAYVSSWRPWETIDPRQKYINEQFEKANLGDRLNILLLGTDIVPSNRANERNWRPPTNSLEGRSDTVLLVHFDPAQSKVNVLSIPRDTRTSIPGHGEHKINVANVYGGAALAAQTVTHLTGAPINRYVRINPQGVVELIDALGGVTVYIPRAMRYSDDSQHLYINLPQGWHTLSGLQAQQYLRFRADELGDIGRVQRQQALLRALADRAVRPETLVKIPEILEIVKKNIDTNLSIQDIFALAKFARQIDLKQDLRMIMLPGRFSRPGEYGISYWLPQTETASRLGARFFGAEGQAAVEQQALEPTRVHISIQNATGSPGMARQLARQLQKAGFRHIGLMSDRPDPIWTTEILPQNGNLEAADLVKAALPVGSVRVEATGSLQSDVTIRLGRDWLKYLETQAAGSTPR